MARCRRGPTTWRADHSTCFPTLRQLSLARKDGRLADARVVILADAPKADIDEAIKDQGPSNLRIISRQVGGNPSGALPQLVRVVCPSESATRRTSACW